MSMKIAAIGLLVVAGGCERAMGHLERMHERAEQAEAQTQTQSGQHSGDVTLDLQPGAGEWKKSRHLHQFYELTKTSFANGADKVDFAAYQEKSYVIFRALGASTGGGKAAEEGMLDHLKDIPRQMVGIVKDDPAVLESYDRFWVALSGPP